MAAVKRAGRTGPGSSGPKTIHFVSLGCPKNRVDSEVMLGVAAKEGYRHVSDPTEAGVIVVNTCGFIDAAKQESIETILELAAHKQRDRGDGRACRKLVVAGCLSQRHPDELAAEIPEVDHFLGSSDMLKLADVLRGDAARMLVGHPAQWTVQSRDPRLLTTHRGSAYVKIAEGCNRSCSFCVIPQLRGKQRSRTVEDIVREVEQLAAQGVREINLISQDTIAYGRDLGAKSDRPDLPTLVERVADVSGIAWVRLFYLYPEAMTKPLVELLAQHPRVLPYVDMPLQHAADAMLKRMRRGHGGPRLRKVVDTLRTSIEDLTFRTAFIVGHPGETEEAFEELVDFVKWAEFDRMGVFLYSDEESSRSATQDGKVSRATAAKRQRKLMSLQRTISKRKNRSLVGRELDVLVEGTSPEHELVLYGRHQGQAPDIDGHVFLSGDASGPGSIVRVEVTQASDYDVVGEVLGPTDEHDQTGRVQPRVRLQVVQTDGRIAN